MSAFGWLGQWNTTTVPNGTYTLQSVATDSAGATGSSAPVTITVSNAPPTTSVLVPSTGATVSGASATLDATASANVTSVTFELSGGDLNDQAIGTATSTVYGWLSQWNTTTVPNGTYTLQSVASYARRRERDQRARHDHREQRPADDERARPLGRCHGVGCVSDPRRHRIGQCDLGHLRAERRRPQRPGHRHGDLVRLYGWLNRWNTTTVPNGTYTLQSVASYARRRERDQRARHDHREQRPADDERARPLGRCHDVGCVSDPRRHRIGQCDLGHLRAERR